MFHRSEPGVEVVVVDDVRLIRGAGCGKILSSISAYDKSWLLVAIASSAGPSHQNNIYHNPAQSNISNISNTPCHRNNIISILPSHSYVHIFPFREMASISQYLPLACKVNCQSK